MASPRDKLATFVHREDETSSSADVAVVTADELQAAKRDPRVRAFLDEADAYLIALEQQGRNR